MANGLKFSEQELADLRQVVYGGFKKTDVRPLSVHPEMRGRTTGGDKIDFDFYGGQRPRDRIAVRGYDPLVAAEKGSASANFAKIARELGIKKVDSEKDLQQMYDYVLGYTPPPAAAPVQETAAPDVQTGFDPGNVLSGLDEHDPNTGAPRTDGGTQPGTQGPGTQEPDIASIFADQIKVMQNMFTQSIQQQQMQFQQMQQAQNQRMEALQAQMMQSMRDQAAMQQTRPEVAGVKMAEGTGGTPMQIARRGMTGAFSRRGMRISSLNV